MQDASIFSILYYGFYYLSGSRFLLSDGNRLISYWHCFFRFQSARIFFLLADL